MAAKRPAALNAFCSRIFGAFPALVNVQEICAAGSTLAAGIVSSKPVKFPKLAGLPVTAALASVQVAPVKLK